MSLIKHGKEGLEIVLMREKREIYLQMHMFAQLGTLSITQKLKWVPNT